MLLLRFLMLLLLVNDVAVVALPVAATLAICFCTSPPFLTWFWTAFGRPPSRRRWMVMELGWARRWGDYWDGVWRPRPIMKVVSIVVVCISVSVDIVGGLIKWMNIIIDASWMLNELTWWPCTGARLVKNSFLLFSQSSPQLLYCCTQ